jgi:regulator of sirC expression with transglutaminase-like and TPR domain
MSANAPPLLPAPLSERQREALISLLSDDDPMVYQEVRARLLSFGPVARDWLRPHALASDPVLRRRSQEIVHYLARQEADGRFLRFCQQRTSDLDWEEGAWLLAQTQFPELNLEAYRALLDSYAGELRGRTDPASHPKATLQAINQYLFQNLAFAGNERDYYDPDNSYLNRVVDRRTGNPISLCAVYMMVTRRLQLPVTGVGLPGHFLCRFQSSTCEIYIDCFNLGRFLTKADCMRYLVQNRCSLQEGYLTPMSGRRILLRMCANLHQIYLHHELAEETGRLQRYLAALGK